MKRVRKRVVVKMTKKHESDLTVKNIPIDKIHQLENSRVNYSPSDLADLMSSIRQHGLMQPPGVREHPKKPGEYELLYGNRRYLAFQKLGRDEIPCAIVEAKGKSDFIVKNLVENLQRANLTPFEEGRYFSDLKKQGLSMKEIAARLNINEKQVSNSITIFEHVPEEFRESIQNPGRTGSRKGILSAGIAAKVVQGARSNRRTKKEIGELIRAAKDQKLNDHHVSIVTRLMREGMGTKKAIESVTTLKPVTVSVMMSQKVIDQLEKKYKEKIHIILKNHLMSEKEFKIIKRSTIGQKEEDFNDNLELNI